MSTNQWWRWAATKFRSKKGKSKISPSSIVGTGATSSRRIILTAYATRDSNMVFRPATERREWMTETKTPVANRCLPMRIANEAGWVICADRRTELIWNGGHEPRDLQVQSFPRSIFDDIEQCEINAVSHFGDGILTWRIPYLFRTPAGINLYVRGPTNWYLDGVVPLDGIVETDWSAATFTMNWKVTRANHMIVFKKGDPVCMIFPFPRGMFENVSPELRDIDDDCEIAKRYREWAESRSQFNRRRNVAPDSASWQKHYYVGTNVRGETFGEHQLRLRLQSVKDRRRKSV